MRMSYCYYHGLQIKHAKIMHRQIAVFIINLEQRELFTYFLLLLKVLLSSPWGKNLFFEIFQNLGCKWGNPQIDPKKSKITILIRKMRRSVDMGIYLVVIA